MFTLIIVKLLLLVLFICLVAYLSGIETALLSLSQIGISRITEKKPKTTGYFDIWKTRPDSMLAAILIGTTLANIGAGVVSASLAIDTTWLFGEITLVAMPVIVALTIILFGDIIPKIYSRYNSEKVCSKHISAIARFSNLINPLSESLLKIAKLFMKLAGTYGKKESPFLTKGDLKFILSQDSALDIDLPKYEKELLNNILSFSERKVRDVMIPRSEIFAIDYKSDFDKIIKDMAETRYSRIPVYKDSIDNIIGVIYTKDLIIVLREKQVFTVDDLISKVYFVPENILVKDLLREFKIGRHHISIVVDEFGITQGLVTIEDLVEEIVGDIYDEYDIREKNIIEMPGNLWIIKASESINSVNETLNLGIPANDNFTTVGGWVLTLFGRIPSTGEKLEYKNFTIEIADSDGKKINKIRINKKQFVV